MKPYHGLSDRKHFWMAVKPCRINTFLDGQAQHKLMLKVGDLIKSDRRSTIRMIADELNLNHQTIGEMLTHDLNMRKIVLSNLNQEQKYNRNNVSFGLRIKITGFFKIS